MDDETRLLEYACVFWDDFSGNHNPAMLVGEVGLCEAGEMTDVDRRLLDAGMLHSPYDDGRLRISQAGLQWVMNIE